MDIPTLIAALIIVESGGDPQAVGDNGLAIGVLQIHPVFVEDVNRIIGRDVYTLADRSNPELSIEMVKVWATYYKGRWEERIGRTEYPIHESDLAVMFNRGWSGYWKCVPHQKETEYWKKVKAIYEANQWKITP